MMSKKSFLGFLLAVIAAPVWAQVTVTDPWVRGTVAGQRGTGAYMQLTSAVDTTLVGASSPAAAVVEVHEMTMEGGIMRMRALDKLPLRAGKPVALKPGGYHVMLMELKRPLNEGDTVPVTLTFEDKEGRKSVLEVKAPVKSLAAILR